MVDDTPFNLLIAENFLKELNIDIEKASNGQEAVEAVVRRAKKRNEKEYFSVIFMDCNMPVMDGYAATIAIRTKISKGEIPNLRIVAMTAFVGEKEVTKCLTAGMDDYLSKPCPKEMVISTFNRWST